MVSLHAALVAMALSGAGPTVLYDFYSENCGPCKAMDPTVRSLIAKGYPVKRIDVDKLRNKPLAKKYNVDPIPCFVMVVDGQEVARAVGGNTSYEHLERMCRMARSPVGEITPPLVANIPAPGARAPGPVSGTPSAVGAAQSGLRQAVPVTMQASASQTPAAMLPGFAAQPPQAPATSWQNSPAAVTPAALQRESGDAVEKKVLAASVRLRVQDPSGFSCGSGTIIDARNGKALILTCGHIFRDSKGNGQIEVDVFGPNGQQRVLGRLESYDSEVNDVGLVSIQTPGPVMAARIAPPGSQLSPGQSVISVGCNNGDAPTARHSQVKSLGPANGMGPTYIWVSDQPVEGRSGGGLFSSDGMVIGVCNAADARDKEGYYAALGHVYTELDRAHLEFVYKQPAESTDAVVSAVASGVPGSPSAVALASAEMPATSKPMPAAPPLPSSPQMPAVPQLPTGPLPDSFAASPAGAVAVAGNAPGGLTNALDAGIKTHEQAALNEFKQKVKRGATVVCTVITPDGQSEVYIIDNASSDFRKQLSAESRDGKSTMYPTSAKEPPQRKTILEWQSEPSSQNAAWRAEGAK